MHFNVTTALLCGDCCFREDHHAPFCPYHHASLALLRDGRTGGLTLWLLLVQSVLALCGVGYALVLRALIDAAVAGLRLQFLRSTAWLIGLILFQIALRAVERHLSEYTRATLENRFKGRLFATLLQKDYAAVAAVHSGEWLNRLTSDTTVVADTMAQVLPGAAGMLVRLIAAAAVLLYIEPRLAAVILPAGCSAGPVGHRVPPHPQAPAQTDTGV